MHEKDVATADEGFTLVSAALQWGRRSLYFDACRGSCDTVQDGLRPVAPPAKGDQLEFDRYSGRQKRRGEDAGDGRRFLCRTLRARPGKTRVVVRLATSRRCETRRCQRSTIDAPCLRAQTTRRQSCKLLRATVHTDFRASVMTGRASSWRCARASGD